MLFTGIAAADQYKKAEMGLSDQEYYDKYVSPYAKQRYRQAVGEGGAMERGAKKQQQQLVSAQFGGTPTSMGTAATESMAPTFRRAMQGAIQKAQADADRYGSQKMLEREQEVAGALQNVALTNQIESAIAALIPYAGPYISAGTLAGGALLQAGTKAARTGANQRPVRTAQFDESIYGDSSPAVSRGGGGLYDLYNLTYG
jgi:hypothetical protein